MPLIQCAGTKRFRRKFESVVFTWLTVACGRDAGPAAVRREVMMTTRSCEVGTDESERDAYGDVVIVLLGLKLAP
jgi:hypothetical protein